MIIVKRLHIHMIQKSVLIHGEFNKFVSRKKYKKFEGKVSYYAFTDFLCENGIAGCNEDLNREILEHWKNLFTKSSKTQVQGAETRLKYFLNYIFRITKTRNSIVHNASTLIKIYNPNSNDKFDPQDHPQEVIPIDTNTLEGLLTLKPANDPSDAQLEALAKL